MDLLHYTIRHVIFLCSEQSFIHFLGYFPYIKIDSSVLFTEKCGCCPHKLSIDSSVLFTGKYGCCPHKIVLISRFDIG